MALDEHVKRAWNAAFGAATLALSPTVRSTTASAATYLYETASSLVTSTLPTFFLETLPTAASTVGAAAVAHPWIALGVGIFAINGIYQYAKNLKIREHTNTALKAYVGLPLYTGYQAVKAVGGAIFDIGEAVLDTFAIPVRLVGDVAGSAWLYSTHGNTPTTPTFQIVGTNYLSTLGYAVKKDFNDYGKRMQNKGNGFIKRFVDAFENIKNFYDTNFKAPANITLTIP